MNLATMSRYARNQTHQGAFVALAVGSALSLFAVPWMVGKCNPVWLTTIFAGALSAFLAAWRWRLGVLLLFAWAPFPDLLKRLMLIEPSSVGAVEWNSVLFVPDLILLAVLLGLIASGSYRCLLANWHRLDSIVLIFLIICSLQVLNPQGPLLVGLAGFKLTAIYVFLYFVGALADRQMIIQLLKMTMVLGVITAVYAIGQIGVGLAPYEKLWLEGGYTDYSAGVIFTYGLFRPFSTFASNAEFGLFLCVSILCTFTLWGFIDRRSPSLLFAFIALLLLLLLVRSLHRGSWAVMLIASAPLVMLRLRKGTRVIFFVFFCLFVMSLILFLRSPAFGLPTASEFARRAFTLGTYQARIDGMLSFIKNAEYHSLLGNGLGMANFARVKFGDGIKAEPHNQFVEWSYELGLIGLVVVVWLIAVFYRKSLHSLSLLKGANDRRGYRIASIGLAYVTGLLFFGLLIQGFWVARPANMYFWFLVGLLPRAHTLALRGLRCD